MNTVAFYSNTKESKVIAEYFANKLEYPLVDIEKEFTFYFQNLVLVFPVHCQNIPEIVKNFLKKVSVDNLTIIATYGKMCCGNVLYEIQNKYQINIVAGAYVPTKHAYIENDNGYDDFDKLDIVIKKIQNPSSIRFPKLYKNPLANFFPTLRSRIGLIIQKSSNCIGCNLCAKNCSFDAIKSGTTNKNCIRCLKCVNICPQHALKPILRFPLKLYLRKKKQNQVIVYV